MIQNIIWGVLLFGNLVLLVLGLNRRVISLACLSVSAKKNGLVVHANPL